MKIFNINKPSHKRILKEELTRLKHIILEGYGYSMDEIWDAMSNEEKDTVLYSAKVTNPEELRNMSWDSIPADVQDTIDLSDYELAKYDQAGRTNLRAIENYMKTVPNLGQLTGKFLAKVGRERKNDLTIKQSYQLLNAIQKFKEAGSTSPTAVMDTTADDIAKRNFMDAERQSGRTSGLD
jgi:hypothetical protein